MNKICKDTFWEMIAQGREACAGNLDALVHWLEDKLAEMGPEAALEFDAIVHAYYSLAYKYGLWNAASIMCNGCTDDGFWDFLGWLIAQGREVYLAALKDPDSLADAPDYQDQRFACLPHMGDRAYVELTGREIYEEFDPTRYDALKAELKKDIVYGDGIGYPYDATDVPAYLPHLCQRYMPEGVNIGAWNGNSLEIRAARATAQKSKKIKKDRGESR